MNETVAALFDHGLVLVLAQMKRLVACLWVFAQIGTLVLLNYVGYVYLQFVLAFRGTDMKEHATPLIFSVILVLIVDLTELVETPFWIGRTWRAGGQFLPALRRVSVAFSGVNVTAFGLAALFACQMPRIMHETAGVGKYTASASWTRWADRPHLEDHRRNTQ